MVFSNFCPILSINSISDSDVNSLPGFSAQHDAYRRFPKMVVNCRIHRVHLQFFSHSEGMVNGQLGLYIYIYILYV